MYWSEPAIAKLARSAPIYRADRAWDSMGVASKEYTCRLRYFHAPFLFGAARWEDAGELLTIPINFSSMSSQIEALLSAMGQGSGGESIEKYRLRVHDEDGNVLQTIVVSSDQLEWHKAGYPVDVADGTAPRSLEDFTDDQLIAELRRRLAERWTEE